VLHIGARNRPEKPLSRAKVIFTRHSSTPPDDDNLAGSFKSVRDGLKDAGVIVDDKSANIVAEYRWSKTDRNKGFITVEIEEIP